MKKYTAHFPFIPSMGSVSPMPGLSDKPTETKEEEALWHLNHSRDHDGLPRLRRLPRGTKFVVDKP